MMKMRFDPWGGGWGVTPTVGALEYAHGSSLHKPQGTAHRLRDKAAARQEPPAPSRPCPSCSPRAGHPAGRVRPFTGTLPSSCPGCPGHSDLCPSVLPPRPVPQDAVAAQVPSSPAISLFLLL